MGLFCGSEHPIEISNVTNKNHINRCGFFIYELFIVMDLIVILAESIEDGIITQRLTKEIPVTFKLYHTIHSDCRARLRNDYQPHELNKTPISNTDIIELVEFKYKKLINDFLTGVLRPHINNGIIHHYSGFGLNIPNFNVKLMGEFVEQTKTEYNIQIITNRRNSLNFSPNQYVITEQMDPCKNTSTNRIIGSALFSKTENIIFECKFSTTPLIKQLYNQNEILFIQKGINQKVDVIFDSYVDNELNHHVINNRPYIIKIGKFHVKCKIYINGPFSFTLSAVEIN